MADLVNQSYKTLLSGLDQGGLRDVHLHLCGLVGAGGLGHGGGELGGVVLEDGAAVLPQRPRCKLVAG
ncbi:hypothetical protein Taro_050147 [Colocasia esculenta]|uniref:Uncharacterized protein n=1 Tax=Colocasia esculenta TaxID=4460 RepID=A0A843XD49_COLES|nr:hypothetical protein [Colocasia esculenta]